MKPLIGFSGYDGIGKIKSLRAARLPQAILPTGAAWPLAGVSASAAFDWSSVETPGSMVKRDDAAVSVLLIGGVVAILVWAFRSR